MFKPKLLQQNQGFTLVEVLVAILITTLFISVAMQVMVFAAIFKVRAQEYTEATNWIQSDLENVKYQANNLQFRQTTLANNFTKGSTSITVSSLTAGSVNLFANGGTIQVGLDPTKYTISNFNNTTTFTITPSLGTNQAQNAAVSVTTICNPSNINAGLADQLRDRINSPNAVSDQTSNYYDNPSNDSSSNGVPRTFRTGQQFSMRRTTELSSKNVLKLKYEVSPGSTFAPLKSIAKFNTEIIPNVAFQCP